MRGKSREAKHFLHPEGGLLILTYEAIDLRGSPRQQLLVYQAAPSPTILADSLGESWSILSNGHKLHPNASLLHPAIDAAIALSKHPGFVLNSVASVDVRMLPFAASVTRNAHPAPGSEARFSAAHCVAFALQAGYVGLDSFSAAAVDDPEVARLRDKITVTGDDGVGKRGARLSITTHEGTTLDHAVQANRGTPDNPMSDDDLDAKLRSIAVPRLGIKAANQLIDSCWRLDAAPRASDVMGPFRQPD